jgi:hypothetical protein
MIPMVAIVDIRHRSEPLGRLRRDLYLWLPLFLLWLLLLPFALLAAPFLLLALLILGRNPFAVFAALFDLLSAVTGTRIEITSPDARVFIRVL